jgi:hypothetical protein
MQRSLAILLKSCRYYIPLGENQGILVMKISFRFAFPLPTSVAAVGFGQEQKQRLLVT